MKCRLLLGYQLLTGLSDTSTGLLLIVAPATTLHLMKLHPLPDSLPFLSYIGAFVLSIGIAGFYGAALLAVRPIPTQKLEVVWLLTAITRGIVALFVVTKVLSGTFEFGWIAVAFTDGIFAVLQSVGLARDWLSNAAS